MLYALHFSSPSNPIMTNSTRFLLSNNFAFLCSAPLRDYLLSTAKAQNLTLSALCRTALVEFQKHPKSIVTKRIGARILKNTKPSPRVATITVTIPKTLRSTIQLPAPKLPHPLALQPKPEYKPLRQWLADYAKDQGTTASTILRRAAYEYALRVNHKNYLANNPDAPDQDEPREDPQLLVDAWPHYDDRGIAAKLQAQERTKPKKAVPLRSLDIPLIQNPERVKRELDYAYSLFEKRDYKIPETKRYYLDPDMWVIDNEWGNG